MTAFSREVESAAQGAPLLSDLTEEKRQSCEHSRDSSQPGKGPGAGSQRGLFQGHSGGELAGAGGERGTRGGQARPFGNCCLPGAWTSAGHNADMSFVSK